MAQWMHEYQVEATSPIFRNFPLDMLRREQVWPKDEADSAAIVTALDSSMGFDGWKTPINLVTIKDTKSWSPVEGRWISFGWTVKTHNAYRR